MNDDYDTPEGKALVATTCAFALILLLMFVTMAVTGVSMYCICIIGPLPGSETDWSRLVILAFAACYLGGLCTPLFWDVWWEWQEARDAFSARG